MHEAISQIGTRRARLLELCRQVLGDRRLVLVSNRGPVEHHLTPDGQAEARRGSGGVVTALSALTHTLEFTWVASAMGEGDRRAAEESHGQRIRSALAGHRIFLRYVTTPRRIYHKYYNIFCNPLLWFLQHYMWNSPYNPNVDATVHDAWTDGYVPVNEAFARAVRDEVQDEPSPVVMVHDYHLYLVPGLIRRDLPGATIQHFVHIPWPTPRYWQLLPAYMRCALLESLCSADIVGFQAIDDVRNFLDCVEEFLPQADVDHRSLTVAYANRQTHVRAYPISIDIDEVRKIATSPRALEYERRLRLMCNERTIVRVDRTEPSKNIVRGFRAYGLLLDRHPEWRGRVNFLAFLVPSRTHIRQYQRYTEEVDAAINEVNTAFGNAEWRPITVFYENNHTQALAAMKLYDVLLVNAVIDGMNLVSKEGPVVNTRNGVLLLSETTGAHRQLRDGAIGIAPADIEGTMQALHQALVMDEEERQQRNAALVSAIEQQDITHWLHQQFQDLASLGR